MKRKVTKARNCKDIHDRMAGRAVWRVTGPCGVTQRRVTVEFTGTRAEADRLQLRVDDNGTT